jgi:uncharacterized protein YndB with AHSA1/START domain
MPETKVVSNLADRSITIDRTFDAPRELVWKAWTEPERLAKWAGCDGTHVPLSTIEVDLRPGGTFRWIMVSDADGDRREISGTYLEVVEPERLVFTWRESSESVVTITLTDRGDKTEMRLQQVGFTSTVLEYGLRDVRDGMGEEIDRLAAYLTGEASLPSAVSA